MKKTIKVPQNLTRSGVASFDAETKSLRLSISSDVPYLRYDFWDDEEYYEELDHSPKGVDLSRLKNGAALLFNHNRDILLGTLSDPVVEGGRCYVEAKISQADDVDSYRTKIEEGILKDTSIGYTLLDEGECVGQKDGIPVYRFRFAIHEASLVTIPADTGVGVGRQRDHKPEGEPKEISVRLENNLDENGNLIQRQNPSPDTSSNLPMKNKARKLLEADNGANATTGTASTVDLVKERNEAIDGFKARCKRINDYVAALKSEGWRKSAAAIAAKHIGGEADFDSFRTEALDSFEGVSRVDEGTTAEIGMGKKDLSKYSLARAIYLRGMGKALDGIEKEASDAQAKSLHRDADGFFIPEDWSNRSLQEIHGLSTSQVRALAAGNFASAGALIGTDLLAGSLVELLRNKAVVMSLGPTHLGGLVGNVAIPKQVGGATAYWLSEGGSVTASDQSFAQVGLTPHRLVAQTAFDKQLVAQASVSVEAIVRNDIALVMAIKKDLAALTGSGASGEPLGILNTTGVQTVTISGAVTWANILDYENKLATANADQTGTPVWLTNPAVRAKLKAAVKVSASTFANFIWGDMTGGNTVNGYASYVTNQIGVAGTGAYYLYYFVPSELIVADWAGIDVVVNPFSLDSTGQIRTTVTQWTDIAVRHPAAFVVSSAAANS